jgi:hypothetical protein
MISSAARTAGRELSKGPAAGMLSAHQRGARDASGESGPSVIAFDARVGERPGRERGDAAVAGEVEDDGRVSLGGAAEVAPDRVLARQHDPGSEHRQSAVEHMRPGERGLAREDPDMPRVDERLGERCEAVGVERRECEGDRVLEAVPAGARRSAVADALPRGGQLPRHGLSDPGLELGVALEAELGGESDDGGPAGLGLAREVGDGAEGETRGVVEDDPSDSPFGWR